MPFDDYLAIYKHEMVKIEHKLIMSTSYFVGGCTDHILITQPLNSLYIITKMHTPQGLTQFLKRFLKFGLLFLSTRNQMSFEGEFEVEGGESEVDKQNEESENI